MNDDEWKKFQQVAKSGDTEEVETNLEDEDLEDADNDNPDNPANDRSKPEGDDDTPDDPENPGGDNPEEDEEDDPKNPKDPKPEDEYKPRLTQYLDSEGKPDLKKLEDAYINSSKEAVNLNNRLKDLEGQNKQILDAIARDPEIAKKLLGEQGAEDLKKSRDPEPPKDPYARHIQSQITRKQKEQYDEFVEQNPEAVSDPDRAEKISWYLSTFGPAHLERTGEIAEMKEMLVAAYRHFGWDLADEQADKLANAAKTAASTTPTPKASKPAPKQQFTKEQVEMARKLGYSTDDLKKSIKQR